MHRTHFGLLLVFVLPVLTSGSWQDTVWCSTSDDVYCPSEDSLCEKDKLGYEAICQLHREIDDDHNGNLDRSESDEFIRDELNYKDGFDRQSVFHGSDDLISVSDLWHLWINSPVYNWTSDDVVDWLVAYVELPQYAHNFRVNGVDGHMLPRIAIMNGHYVGSILGIKGAVHKKKLAVKAMDIVMFGPPKRHSYLKDLALIGSLVVAVGGCWLAYVQHSYSQTQMKKVLKDLDHLQASEQALTQLNVKLEVAQKEHKNIAEEKHNMEQILKTEMNTAKQEAERLREARETTAEEISRLRLAEEELVQVRNALKKAEKELDGSQKAPLANLQHWLQLNYEIENKHFEMKKESAEKELENAKEMCEKIRRKRMAFLGSLRIAHSASLDETDRHIMKARASLEDVKLDLQERSSRWYEIEKICGFNITANSGLQSLSAMLNQSTGYLGYCSSSNLMNSQGLSGSSMSMGDSDEDQPPGYFASTGTAVRRKHTSNHATPFSTVPLSNSTFSLTTKQRKEKDSKADSKFLSSVQTQPELYNLAKSKVATEFNLEKTPQADVGGKLDRFKAELINPEPRKTTPEPHVGSNLDRNSVDSSKRMDPFRASQESFKLGKIGDFIPDDFKQENDIFKDGLDVFKIGQTVLRRSKDGTVVDRDHGDVTFGSHMEGRPRFDIGDLCPNYDDAMLDDHMTQIQVGTAKSTILHKPDQLHFQKSLPSSLSDSSLLMVSPDSGLEKPTRKTRRLSPRAVPTVLLDDDLSSPESTDSAGQPEKKQKKKRLIRRTLLPKLLKNSPLADKSKYC